MRRRNLFFILVLVASFLNAQTARAGCDFYESLRKLGVDVRVEADFFKNQGKRVVAYNRAGERQVITIDEMYMDVKGKQVKPVMKVGEDRITFGGTRGFSKVEPFDPKAMPEGSVERALDEAIESKAKVKIHNADGTTVEGTVVGYQKTSEGTIAIVDAGKNGVKYPKMNDVESMSGGVAWKRGSALPSVGGTDIKIGATQDSVADEILRSYTEKGDIVTITVKEGKKTRKITGVIRTHTGVNGEITVVENGKFEFRELTDPAKGTLGSSTPIEFTNLSNIDRTHFVGENKQIIKIGDRVELKDGTKGTVTRIYRDSRGMLVDVVDDTGKTALARYGGVSKVKKIADGATTAFDYGPYVGKKVSFKYKVGGADPNASMTVKDAEFMGVSNGKIHYRVKIKNVSVDKYIAESQLEHDTLKVVDDTTKGAAVKPKAGAQVNGEDDTVKIKKVDKGSVADAPVAGAKPPKAQQLLDDYKTELDAIGANRRQHYVSLGDEAKAARGKADKIRATNPKMAAKYEQEAADIETLLDSELAALRKACNK